MLQFFVRKIIKEMQEIFIYLGIIIFTNLIEVRVDFGCF